MKYKMIASDLDGTLLYDLHSVSAENYRAISEYKKTGGEFVPTTGRCFYQIPERLRKCDDIRFYISSNGAVVTDKLTGELDEQLISNELFEKIKKITYEYETLLAVHSEGYGYMLKKDDSNERANCLNLSSYFYEHLHETCRKVDDWEKSFTHKRGIEMIVAFFRYRSDLEKCVKRLNELGGLVVTSSENFNIEIIAEGASKGNGIRRLAKRLGLSVEEIIGVGDSPNDISLLNGVGLPLAVSNAADELKAIADRVICSHKEHIVRYISDNIIK